MTSERRAYIVVIALTIGGMCFYGQNVEHWTVQAIFGIIGAGATAFIAGMTKSPRDGALSDLATPPVTEVQQATDTTVKTHTEAV
jgi:hypothetical protein